MGSGTKGVAYAILEAGGADIENECQEYKQKGGKTLVGSASCSTGAGNMR